jgi:CHASE2 domain-containing sensor protein
MRISNKEYRPDKSRDVTNIEHRTICDIYEVRIMCFLVFVLVLASCRKQVVAEEEIVLINAEILDRAEFAEELDHINALDPKLVALDIFFSEDRDPHKDVLLQAALKKTKRLFMISTIDDYGYGRRMGYKQFGLGSLPVFLEGAQTGFANTIINEDEMRTLSRFSTHEYVDGNFEYHFGVRLAMAYDSLHAMRFIERHPRIVDVDFKNGERRFKTFSASDVLGKRISKQDIEDKIVMLGFLGPGNEDKFFTPLNNNTDEPDMYGIVYLAHVVAQVMESE